MPTLAQIWPSLPGQWRPADQRPAAPHWGDTWFGPDGNTIWYWAGENAYQFRTDHITKDLYDMPETHEPAAPYESHLSPADPRVHDSPFRDPDARYRSTIHTEPARTIRIDAEGLDAGVYVELLRLITDRWPRAKLAGGGIVVPEETEPVTRERLVDRTRHTDPNYWRQHFNEHIVTALADAARLPLVAVAELLAEHGRTHPDPHATIAAFIHDQGLTKP